MTDTQLERLKRQVNDSGGYTALNGIEITKLEPGYCEGRAEMGQDKTNPHGMAHGGFLFTLCDTVGGIAATTLGRSVVGRSADIHYLRPGKATGSFTAKGRVVEAGRHIALCAVELFDDEGTLLVTASVEMFFLGSD